jgi:hypothetical protein
MFLITGRRLSKLWHITFMCLTAGLVWEFITPLYKKSSVADWWDVIAYMCGGVFYWILTKTSKSLKE